MKLSFTESCGNRNVLCREDERRVEIYVLDQQDKETYLVVALAGTVGQVPDRLRCMGPFYSREQAQGAVAAVQHALVNEGFAPVAERCEWEMVAAREARAIRHERELNAVDAEFVPLGIMPEKPEPREPR